MKIAVIVIAVLAVVVLAVLLLRQGHPEQTATHSDASAPDDESGRLYKGVDRPAGPDVEDQSLGDPTVGGRSQPGAEPPGGSPERPDH